MGWVEQARDNISKPLASEQLSSVQNEKNKLTRDFLSKKIDLKTFRKKLSNYDESDFFILPFVGPLYGLLRRLGVDKDEAKRITYEERDHYLVLREQGLNSHIMIASTKDENEDLPSEIKKLSLHVFISYKIPNTSEEDKLREVLKDISLAPQNPSPDDLAKLPEDMLPSNHPKTTS